MKVLIDQSQLNKGYYGRVLSSSCIFEIQKLQVDLSTIVSITNHTNSNRSEETLNMIRNSLDHGLDVLFKMRYELLGE